jgi:hypothetical protein
MINFIMNLFDTHAAGYIYAVLLAIMLAYIVLSLIGYPPRFKKHSLIAGYFFVCIFAVASIMATGGNTIREREDWLWLVRAAWAGGEVVLFIGLARALHDVVTSYYNIQRKVSGKKK